MGQKVHPVGFRLGITKDWESRWVAKEKGKYVNFLHEDLKIRKLIKQKYYHAGIARIDIERTLDKINIRIWAARPGLLIARKGAQVKELRKILEGLTGKSVYINIEEVKHPQLNAQLVAENVAAQLERRVAFRRAMKRVIADAMRAGAKGIKVQCAGRLGGADMARTEWYREGRVPLQTIRADIDYGTAVAQTKYGVIGVKVWIYKGDVYKDETEEILKRLEKEVKEEMARGE
ncbi:30S ribosomal protein S3 [Desulfurobacterium indicum]|uniref:Small ribosomal subunit protein uS3 n=1 Tax=Desulfurobacterium indicum TaxID=1914305 RepID=A0A1R1MKG0_9BACT|nr:30S ribosomal protein S3 [Desulfurobacterium indicum]OMH40249.1 30S ribosomal protein S3 [Desulfurobacterium indicum]